MEPVQKKPRNKAPDKPEQTSGSGSTQTEDCKRGDQVPACEVFADYDVESEDRVCNKTGKMADYGIFFEHILLLKQAPKLLQNLYICTRLNKLLS